LRHCDEIRIGHTGPVFRDALTALCRPLLARDIFTEPASTRAIADELVITQAAVKQHLANLYEKFGVAPADSHRRAALANEWLRRGAVSLTELRESE
jgi:predicted transcriptional regulator